MKAVQINTYGGPEVLEINENAPQPTPKDGQVLVEIHAASINPVDWKIREGYFKEMVPLQLPVTLGGDFAGKVVESGEEVFGSAIVLGGGSGSFAEFAAANTKNIAPKPNSLSFEQAAALPLVGSSAVQALEEHIKLQKSQKILIHGGAGGIGHVAIQLAKHIGAHVVTTVSSEDVEFAKQLGADEVIDYKKEQFENSVKDVDAVFDTVGGETTNKSFQVLKKARLAEDGESRRGGVLVSMAGQPDENKAKELGITAISQMTNTNSMHLKRVAQLVNSGIIHVAVDKVFPLEQVQEAFAYQEEIHPKGKVVLNIKA